ncbi:MAG: hypothetical protein N3E45_08815 [Oscillatoriaceae bacterium SKW80]|nr:hypothetical protein [Oscillatoriaceae bacterium SKW80]
MRGQIDAKNKGKMEMYLVEGIREEFATAPSSRKNPHPYVLSVDNYAAVGEG